MSGSDYRAQKPSKRDKKRLQNIYANHAKTIVNKYFDLKSIVWIFFNSLVCKGKKPPFLMPVNDFGA